MKALLLATLFLLQSATNAAPAQGKFVAHEWGTFTAVQGSNGIPLGGMSHEEESLPSFVVGRNPIGELRDPNCQSVKGMDLCNGRFVPSGRGVYSAEVTQKMETPVIYFYSDRPRAVETSAVRGDVAVPCLMHRMVSGLRDARPMRTARRPCPSPRATVGGRCSTATPDATPRPSSRPSG